MFLPLRVGARTKNKRHTAPTAHPHPPWSRLLRRPSDLTQSGAAGGPDDMEQSSCPSFI